MMKYEVNLDAKTCKKSKLTGPMPNFCDDAGDIPYTNKNYMPNNRLKTSD